MKTRGQSGAIEKGLSGEEEDVVVALVPNKQRDVCGLGGRVYAPEPRYFTVLRCRRENSIDLLH